MIINASLAKNYTVIASNAKRNKIKLFVKAAKIIFIYII